MLEMTRCISDGSEKLVSIEGQRSSALNPEMTYSRVHLEIHLDYFPVVCYRLQPDCEVAWLIRTSGCR